ncbi:Di-copper centre-containing protein [Setomelanomma holmii]|uniref:tyrosinase n=1 Tax=Setomelanomma holmii TaxID=210430 RepID=A0A9P4HB55_9PLEO|nr:Di-copper centre-containing protein [Setomelanomma holmii]
MTIFESAWKYFFILTLWCYSTHSSILDSKYKHRAVGGIATVRREQANATLQPYVLGIRRFEGDTLQPRLEIRELERKPDQFNVLLLGLQRFQNVSQDNPLSYFSIAGIHGRPFMPWGGVEKDPQGSSGYCRHSSNIFATWHRPFLALFEERIYQNAQEVISLFPEGEFKNRMSEALHSFRLPYWDAAAVPPIGEGSYPWCVQRKTIEVELPCGTSTCRGFIANPLYSYVFHPLPVESFRSVPEGSKEEDRWVEWNRTIRNPTAHDATAESQDRVVAINLDWNCDNIRQRTYQMLAMQKNYYNISNNAVKNSQGEVVDSLESVHDTLHNTVGNGGHMWQTQYSSFDPIFWLLHANTDRMLALWQGLHPDSYVTNHSNSLATFATPPKSWADENTPLLPFRCDPSGGFWTSLTVRDHTVFGYTYPELTDLAENDTLIHRVNALYGENATSQFSWDQNQKHEPDSEEPTASSISSSTTPQAQRLDVQYHYFANVRAAKGGADKAYQVFVYLDADQSSGDATSSGNSPSMVGFTGFQSTAYHASELSPDEKQETGGVVALTKALEEEVRAGQLASLDEVTVASYLQEHMSWRVATADNPGVTAENVPDLQIEVTWAKMTPPTPSTFPEVLEGGFMHLKSATSGKADGVQDD